MVCMATVSNCFNDSSLKRAMVTLSDMRVSQPTQFVAGTVHDINFSTRQKIVKLKIMYPSCQPEPRARIVWKVRDVFVVSISPFSWVRFAALSSPVWKAGST